MKRKEILWIAAGFLIFLGAAEMTLSDIETAILREDYRSAEQLSKDFISRKPNKSELDPALYYLGLSEIRLEKYQEATDTFRLLLSGLPESKWQDKAYLGYIDSLYLSGDFRTGLIIAQEFLTKNPRSEYLSLIYLKLARGNFKLANWKEARGYLQKITREFPESLEARLAKQLLAEKQYFAVQVGAFLQRPRAETLTQELKSQGDYAYIVETIDRQGRKFYRVRVGKFASLEEAQNLQSKLARMGYPTQIYP